MTRNDLESHRVFEVMIARLIVGVDISRKHRWDH